MVKNAPKSWLLRKFYRSGLLFNLKDSGLKHSELKKNAGYNINKNFHYSWNLPAAARELERLVSNRTISKNGAERAFFGILSFIVQNNLELLKNNKALSKKIVAKPKVPFEKQTKFRTGSLGVHTIIDPKTRANILVVTTENGLVILVKRKKKV